MHRPSNLAALRAAWRAINAAPDDGFRFRISDAATGRTRLYVSGLIGIDDSADEFVQAVHGITATAIDLHVNSPGGFVWDALAMREALVSHPAHVTTHVDALAGSAASFLALAGDEVETAPGSRWMIHDAQGAGVGSPAEVREYADLLDSVSDDIAGIYAARAGGTPAAWRKAMTATTWYSAAEAVAVKLADRVSGASTSKTPGAASNRTRLQIKARAAVALGGVK